MDWIESILLPAALGLGLAAACGLRVFLPLFITSVLSHFDIGSVGLRDGLGWMSEWPAMIAFGAASVIELLAYYIPVVDHLLDTLAVPLAGIAGTLVAGSTLVDLPPLFTWTFALIAGGGMAAAISTGTAATRVASTATTVGLGNPLIATVETAGSVVLSFVAWFVPVLALLLVVVVLWWVIRRLQGIGKQAKI